MHIKLLAPLVLILSFVLSVHTADAQGIRQRISFCWQHGAFNMHLMRICSGRIVTAQQLGWCLNGGPCFEDPPIPLQMRAAPLCGSTNYPPCPMPQPCGRNLNGVLTIRCPNQMGLGPQAAFCGTIGSLPCLHAQPCGLPGTFPCSLPAMLPPVGLFNLNPTLIVRIPPNGRRPRSPNSIGIQFAIPAVPDLNALRYCHRRARSEDEFFRCAAQRALPDDFRLQAQCLDEHWEDPAAATICSIGDEQAMEAYRHFQEVRSCIEEQGTDDKFIVAQCLGESFLDEEAQYYLRCVTENRGELGPAAVCALSKDLNPEQRIAVACATSTGGEPHAFVTCTAGRLTAREIDKCWRNGIATPGGCFGPNNELRRAANTYTNFICNTTGRSSAICDAHILWRDNVLAPGQNHEVVRVINNAIHDLQNGPGENNEIVKGVGYIEDVFNKVFSIGF